MVASSAKESPGRFDDEEVALLGRRLIASFGRTAGRVPLLFTYVIHEYLNQPKSVGSGQISETPVGGL